MKNLTDRFMLGTLVVSLLVFPACCGCSSSATKFESPEAAFAAIQAAAKAEDYETVCDCLSPISQDRFAGTLVMAGLMAKPFGAMAVDFSKMGRGAESAQTKDLEANLAKVDAVLAKHGVSDHGFEAMSNPGYSKDEPLGGLAATIKNKRKFIADMMEAMRGLDVQGDGGPAAMFDATLVNLEVSEKSASGIAIRTAKGKQIRKPVEFVRSGGYWLIELPNEAFK